MKKIIFMILILVSTCLNANEKNDKIIPLKMISGIEKIENYNTYCNARFGFSVDYPAKYFNRLPEPDNGDGVIIETADGEVSIYVSGMFNAMSRTISEEYNDRLVELENITYKFLGKNTFTISSKDGNQIYFTKVIYDKKKDLYATLLFIYNTKYEKFMKPIVERMVKSFRVSSCPSIYD
ncbi:MAG: hypothetical protein KGV57_05075 [Fusobacterium sp.]|nr:hypothetical protein [Fusobacterium sp.]